jgi:hypothetical protein
MIIILTYQTMLLTSADYTASVNNLQSCKSLLELSSVMAASSGPLVKKMDGQALTFTLNFGGVETWHENYCLLTCDAV